MMLPDCCYSSNSVVATVNVGMDIEQDWIWKFHSLLPEKAQGR